MFESINVVDSFSNNSDLVLSNGLEANSEEKLICWSGSSNNFKVIDDLFKSVLVDDLVDEFSFFGLDLGESTDGVSEIFSLHGVFGLVSWDDCVVLLFAKNADIAGKGSAGLKVVTRDQSNIKSRKSGI